LWRPKSVFLARFFIRFVFGAQAYISRSKICSRHRIRRQNFDLRSDFRTLEIRNFLKKIFCLQNTQNQSSVVFDADSEKDHVLILLIYILLYIYIDINLRVNPKFENNGATKSLKRPCGISQDKGGRLHCWQSTLWTLPKISLSVRANARIHARNNSCSLFSLH